MTKQVRFNLPEQVDSNLLSIEQILQDYRKRYANEQQVEIYPIYKDCTIYLAPTLARAVLFFITGLTDPAKLWANKNPKSQGPDRLLKNSALNSLTSNHSAFEIDSTRIIWHHQSTEGKIICNETYIFPDQQVRDEILQAYNEIINNSGDQALGQIYRQLALTPTKPSKPKLTELKLTEPKLTEPKLTEPKLTEPKSTELKLTEPKLTEPKLTEPKLTGPKLTELKLTEPKLTEPKLSRDEAKSLAKPNQAVIKAVQVTNFNQVPKVFRNLDSLLLPANQMFPIRITNHQPIIIPPFNPRSNQPINTSNRLVIPAYQPIKPIIIAPPSNSITKY